VSPFFPPQVVFSWLVPFKFFYEAGRRTSRRCLPLIKRSTRVHLFLFHPLERRVELPSMKSSLSRYSHGHPISSRRREDISSPELEKLTMLNFPRRFSSESVETFGSHLRFLRTFPYNPPPVIPALHTCPSGSPSRDSFSSSPKPSSLTFEVSPGQEFPPLRCFFHRVHLPSAPIPENSPSRQRPCLPFWSLPYTRSRVVKNSENTKFRFHRHDLSPPFCRESNPPFLALKIPPAI